MINKIKKLHIILESKLVPISAEYTTSLEITGYLPNTLSKHEVEDVSIQLARNDTLRMVLSYLKEDILDELI